MSTLPLRRSARLVSAPSVSSKNRKVCAKAAQYHSEGQVTEDNPRPTKRARKEKASAVPKSSPEERGLEHVDADSTELAQKLRRRKKAETIEPKPEDFPSRVVNPWKVGPHVSSAGGVENAIVNAATVGYTSLLYSSFSSTERSDDQGECFRIVSQVTAQVDLFGSHLSVCFSIQGQDETVWILCCTYPTTRELPGESREPRRVGARPQSSRAH